MMPIVLRHAISGSRMINTEDPLLEDPLALACFRTCFPAVVTTQRWTIHRVDVPCGFDAATGTIECRIKKGLFAPRYGFKARNSTRLTVLVQISRERID